MTSESLFSSSWYRVAGLKPGIRSHARFYRHRYRGQLWYVLQDRATGRSHRLTPAAYQLVGLMDGQRTTQQIWDASFYVLTDCSDMGSCVVGADAAYLGSPERFTYAVPATGRYYLILDARSDNLGGPWTLDYIVDRRSACCFLDGACELLLEEECIDAGGEYRPDLGEACDPNPCPSPSEPVASRTVAAQS